ncbi:hypothetical protein Zm00014a_025043 [Zea mays]|uniref:cinnamyl-alcohol dehydrogenase n=1 Tax=Zea mays TaxID=4577 RepID=A0A3L6G496_MAIZE|nr:hypothetical protein Zm00014a_025043 [Zea mays]
MAPTPTHTAAAVALAAHDSSGHLAPLTITRRSTGDDDVAIKILYCGMCHSDLHSIKNEWHNATYPMVPGHEIAGVVTEVGKNVTSFKAGDRVGVGCMVNSCQSCGSCDEDFENSCRAVIFTYNSVDRDGTVTYGGYSSSVVVHERFVVRFPDAMPLDRGAPLLCAGITVYSPMKYHGLNVPGKHVGVMGLGGLGHAEEMKAAASTMDGIINTVSANLTLAPYMGLLKPNGKMIMVGLPTKPLEIPPFDLIIGNKTLAGSCIGGMRDTQEMINVAAKHGVTADIELVAADYVNTAMERLAKADVRYRFVIDIGNTLKNSE